MTIKQRVKKLCKRLPIGAANWDAVEKMLVAEFKSFEAEAYVNSLGRRERLLKCKRQFTLEEIRASVNTLAKVIDRTANEIDDKERQSLVRAVLRTIAPTNGGPRKKTTTRTKVRSRKIKAKQAPHRRPR